MSLPEDQKILNDLSESVLKSAKTPSYERLQQLTYNEYTKEGNDQESIQLPNSAEDIKGKEGRT